MGYGHAQEVSMDANIAVPAALIGDPTRAALLNTLLDGRPRPSGELARAACVTPQAASNHLARLAEAGLVTAEARGRHRLYRLAGPDVAAALEALARIAPPVKALHPPLTRQARSLRDARSCYDHLAGRVGVAVAEALQARGLIALPDAGAEQFEVTPQGRAWFEAFGVDLTPVARPLARSCIDWTERRPHLAGALGARLLTRLLALGWVARVEGTRGLRLTAAGDKGLREALGVDLNAEKAAA
ncbi:MAG TPA: winged helix-turn-helix domain-containing protein [Caulobacteraceae bacterium]|nr:winged helix-turn-helix domain-containing protein [Caulobacteraceae bacterium]